jgi:hypothetical protein
MISHRIQRTFILVAMPLIIIVAAPNKAWAGGPAKPAKEDGEVMLTDAEARHIVQPILPVR